MIKETKESTYLRVFLSHVSCPNTDKTMKQNALYFLSVFRKSSPLAGYTPAPTNCQTMTFNLKETQSTAESTLAKV